MKRRWWDLRRYFKTAGEFFGFLSLGIGSGFAAALLLRSNPQGALVIALFALGLFCVFDEGTS